MLSSFLGAVPPRRLSNVQIALLQVVRVLDIGDVVRSGRDKCGRAVVPSHFVAVRRSPAGPREVSGERVQPRNTYFIAESQRRLEETSDFDVDIIEKDHKTLLIQVLFQAPRELPSL